MQQDKNELQRLAEAEETSGRIQSLIDQQPRLARAASPLSERGGVLGLRAPMPVQSWTGQVCVGPGLGLRVAG